MNLLIVDDEREIGTFLSHLFSLKGFTVHKAVSANEFYQIDFAAHIFHAAMIDIKLPDGSGLALLQHLKQQQPHCQVLIMTGYSTIKTAVEAMKLGASDYIEKPFDDIEILEKQVEILLKRTPSATPPYIHKLAKEAGMLIGKNPEMNQLVETTWKVAQKSVNVLIEGETGTGKEILSRFIHLASPRRDDPFIGINCGAISESLLESELFGHERGAFTGATQQRKGFFEIAGSGTLFLDEIAEASSAIQVKLLRVLETREFMRVGSSHTLQTNARLVAATNENLQQAVDNRTFREDLFYRLNVVTLELPALRERKEDIPILIHHFIERNGQQSITFSPAAIDKLMSHDWPGNIRELSNVITRTLTFADQDSAISADDIVLSSACSAPARMLKAETPSLNTNNHLKQWRNEKLADFNASNKINLEHVLTEIKQLETDIGKDMVQQALQNTFGNRNEAAKRLHISMRKLRYLLNEKNKTDVKKS